MAFIRESVRELEEKGHEVDVAGIFYHVGENDMSFAPYRKNAVSRLASMFAQSRIDLGRSTLRWFVSQQSPTDHASVNSIDVTSELGRLAATDPALIHVKAFDLPQQDEQLVVTTAGIVQLGELLARRYAAGGF